MLYDPDSDEDGPDALYRPNRRNMLKTLGVAGMAGLAGCGGDGGATETETPTPTVPEVDTESPTDTSTPGAGVTDQYTGAFSSAASTLNWFYNQEASTAERIGLTLDGAWAVTTETEVFPLWLEPSTEDGKTYTMTVRDGLEWSGDYGQMTAEDWVYMINNVFKSDWAAYPSKSDWAGTTVEQTGEMEFTVTLASPDPAWPFRPVLWGQNCAPKEIFQQYVEMATDSTATETGTGTPAAEQAQKGLDEDEDLNNLTYTGNLGPYTFDTWEPEAQFVATRNDEYYMQDRDDVPDVWQDAPYFETYTQRVIPEQSSRLQALKNGEIDSVGIPPKRAQEFIDLDRIDVYVQPQPFVRQITFNMRANGWMPFRDKRVRQAFMMAVDKQSFADNVFRGYAKPAFTMQPTWSKWYDDSQVDTFGAGDMMSVEDALSKMKTALSEMDTEFSYDGDTVINGEGNQAQLSLIAQSGQPTEQTMGEVLKQAFEQLGVTVQVDTVQGTTFQRQYALPQVPEDKTDQVPDDWQGGPFNPGPRDVATSAKPWDLGLIFEFNTYPRTPSDSKVFFYEDAPVNYYGYVPSEGVDIKSTYEEAATTVDEQTRQELFAEAFGTIATEQPFGFLVMEDDIAGYQDGIVGPVEEFGSGWNSNTYFRRSG